MTEHDSRLTYDLHHLCLRSVEGGTAVLRALVGEGCSVTLRAPLADLLGVAAEVAVEAQRKEAQ